MPAGTGPVTSPATGSLHDRLLQDVALILQALNLLGVSQAGDIAQNVYVKALPDDTTDVTWPAIVVCTEAGEEMLEQENFEERSWGYPVAVLLMDSNSTIDPNIRPDFLTWRHALMVAMDELPAKASSYGPSGHILASTPECWNLSLRPRSIFEEWERLNAKRQPTGTPVIATSFVVLCHCQEARNR